MVMLRVASLGTFSSQVAEELESAVVLPDTTAVLPTYSSACEFCVVCCNVTSVASESLVLSCCSTPANSTSCWVNWLVSSGESGFWFCSCVVSSDRKVWKLPAMSALPNEELLDELEDDCGVVPETIGEALV